MSIAYRVFQREPKTESDFVHNTKRKGQKHVDIYVRSYRDEVGSFCDFDNPYHCIVGLQSGEDELPLLELSNEGIESLSQPNIDDLMLEQDAYTEALVIAGRLRGQGLITTIDRKPIDAAIKKIVDYGIDIESLKERKLN